MGIQKRIADIIAGHWSDDVTDDIQADERLWLQCECDARYWHGADEWARHVAEVLVSELGLQDVFTNRGDPVVIVNNPTK